MANVNGNNYWTQLERRAALITTRAELAGYIREVGNDWSYEIQVTVDDTRRRIENEHRLARESLSPRERVLFDEFELEGGGESSAKELVAAIRAALLEEADAAFRLVQQTWDSRLERYVAA
jgi:hypothetical protein